MKDHCCIACFALLLVCAELVPVKHRKKIEHLDEDDQKTFDQLEMQKHLQQLEELLKYDTADERKTIREKIEAELNKRKKLHEPVHHPGSKDQLKETWADEDGLDASQYSPSALFRMHDYDGNNILDGGEISTLLTHELSKIYNDSDPLRDVELSRMRKELSRMFDSNHDGKITYEEFTQKGYPDDDGWEPLQDTEDVADPDDDDLMNDEDLQHYAEIMHEKNPDDPYLNRVYRKLKHLPPIPSLSSQPQETTVHSDAHT